MSLQLHVTANLLSLIPNAKFLDYRQRQRGHNVPGNALPTVNNVQTMRECFQHCRETAGCKAFTHAWKPDLSFNGNCMLKSKQQDGDDYSRESFVMRFNMGQNMFIGRGVISFAEMCKTLAVA